MTEYFKLGDIEVHVRFKNIKNIHLSVMPPLGEVVVSAPERMNLDTVRIYCISRLRWIKEQRRPFLEQEREAPREFIYNERHYLFGKKYKLNIIEGFSDQIYSVKHNLIEIYVKPNSTAEQRKNAVEICYRAELYKVLEQLIEKWASILQVELHEFKIKKMSTKWGSCNQKARRIWFSLELAKKPINCIEYVVVHEMIHLKESKHNHKFYHLLDMHFENWNVHRRELNDLPLGAI